jgi:hypothetical protein
VGERPTDRFASVNNDLRIRATCIFTVLTDEEGATDLGVNEDVDQQGEQLASRLVGAACRASGNTMTGSEKVLVEDWCQQYPSHSVATPEFGADGYLYASGGDGASFNFVDYGQDGARLNPCGDARGRTFKSCPRYQPQRPWDTLTGVVWVAGESGEVEPIEVHDLVPRGHEVTHELLLRVVARVDL